MQFTYSMSTFGATTIYNNAINPIMILDDDHREIN